MIAVDSSALVAIALQESEAERFGKMLASCRVVIGAPTLFETHMVLTGIGGPAPAFDALSTILHEVKADIIPFDQAMYAAAADAFERFGKGRGHPAQLNFGDCMAYAVAKVLDLPLLFKGDDFSRTDIKPAF